MPTRFNLPHIDIADRRINRPYQAPRENRGGGGAPRIRGEHGARLQAQLAASFQAADLVRPTDDRLPEPPQGVYLEVELKRSAKPDNLEKKKPGIKPGAVQLEEDEKTTVALYVPDDARPVLERILEEYRAGELTEKGEPPGKSFVEPIEAIRQARLETFWSDDPAALPADPQAVIWWEVWCYKGMEARIEEVVETLGARAADRDNRLYFPELTVTPVLTNRVTIELMLFATSAISELRRASASPIFFTDAERQDQYGWAENLAERTIWPGADAPAVCLFDTGVNRAHVLLEPALAPNDMTAIYPDWGTTDEPEGHGTGMAGLALHGDLTPLLQDEAERELPHRLESVKIMPPNGFPRTDPGSYGWITQAAVARTEIARPNRPRVFCLAVTNDNVSGARSTTWSAAIDQAAAGAMPGDEEAPRRLFIVCSGNAPAHIERDRILSADEHPVEDPAQAWNALTVGGYTDKIDVQEEDLDGWIPFAEAGDLSPFTRTSVTWPQGKAPFKPDIVMEAGNRAVSPDARDVITVDSLGVLSTGADTDRQPLAPFEATSASAAQAARLAARLTAAHPAYWPETIRALIVHSAEWTEVMKARLDQAGGRREAYTFLRRFGYGVPNFERATASAQNHLALIAQNTIQPFQNDRGRRKFKDCHFYRLPWPRAVLEGLGEQDVRLKVTLSYFVEPNPGVSASIDPQRYQSFGLRFDLRRRLEPVGDFVERVNALERDDPLGRARTVPDDNRWRFGPNSISCGSLHCDEWVGPAAQLAARDIICIKPVIGWWRNRASLEICNKQARYALVVTLSTADVAVDLHTPISAVVEANIDVDIAF